MTSSTPANCSHWRRRWTMRQVRPLNAIPEISRCNLSELKSSSREESRSSFWRLCNCILGVKDDEEVEKKQEMEMEAHIQKLSSLHQTTCQKVLLYSNLVIIVGLAIFLYIFMSISPFSIDELKRFEKIAFNKTHLKTMNV